MAVGVLMVGCSGGDSQPSREQVIEVLSRDDTASRTDPTETACIADSMIDAGLTSAQLDEAAEWDGEGTQPEAVDLYTDALDACGLGAEDRIAEAVEATEGA